MSAPSSAHSAPVSPKPGKVYFISDLHLGAGYDPDSRRRELMAVDFLDSIAADASELYLVGDILDYWYEYRTVVPRGYVRFFGALARLVDSGVKITWMIGNHDIWLFDYLRDEIGIRIVDGSLSCDILGSRFFITHGDGVGRLPLGFRIIRSIFHNRVCQKLYSGIHPRWTVPFAMRWSTHSRMNDDPNPQYHADTDPLAAFARQMHAHDPSIQYFVFGHRHVLVDEAIDTHCHMVILGDWLRHFSYAVFDGHTLQIHRYLPSPDASNR